MRNIFCLVAGLLLSLSFSAQVGINSSNSTPHPSAGLDVDFSDKGVLIPRLTQAQRNALSSPATGLQIFNTTTNCFNFWTGASWKQVCGECDFPNPVAGSNGPVCEGATLQLSASTIPGAVYAWLGPNGFSSSVQNPSIAGIEPSGAGLYTVTASLNGCTSAPGSIAVTVNLTPATPVVVSNSPVCSGDPVNLSASSTPGSTFSWNGPDTFTANIASPVIPAAAEIHEGTYSVTAALNGCSSAAGQTSVVVNPTPVSTFSPLTALAGFPVTFSPSQGGATYSWTFPSGSPSSSTSAAPVVTWAAAGDYGVSLTVSEGGCSATTTSTVDVNDPVTLVYAYTGSQQFFTVPQNVTSVQIECWGAEGKSYLGTAGKGGYAKGNLSVTPGDILYVYVGGQGDQVGNSQVGGGGYNGGGNSNGSGGGGGGASDVRYNAVALGNRVIVAGGGGGSGFQSAGGTGGGLTGGNGAIGTVGNPGGGGFGATQSAGGNGGSPGNGQAGSLGQGGQGGNVAGIGYSGGGGGGYYGGGGGGGEISWGNGGGGGGGGGSSYIGGVTDGITTPGLRSGHGEVRITY